MGTDSNEYTLESDPKWVEIADSNGYGSSRSSVDSKPVCARIGTGPFESVLV